MTSKRIHMPQLNKTACLLIITLLLASSLWAQKTAEREKYDSIAEKYKNENAVYTNYTEKLIITEEDGSLVANTYVTMDKLLISDLSPANDNRDYFWYSDFHPLTNVSGLALIPDKNGGYKRTENYGFGEGGQVTSSFYDDVRGVMAYYSGLTKNSVTETKYTMQHTDIAQLIPFVFKANIPIVNTVYEVTVPNYVKINFVLKNLDNIHVTQTKEEKDGKIIYRFTAKDLHASKAYNLAPSIWYYSPHIIPYISSYRLTGAQKDSLVLKDPDAHYKYEFRHVKDLNIKLDTAITRTVAEITKNDKTPREKAKHIYNWVQKNIHYIAFEKGLEGFVPRPADTVFKRKYGDCKDMASMCMAMCRQAGIKAYFAIIGTWDLPYTTEELPSPNIFNHVICAIKLDDDWVFLDGTDNIQPFGENRFDIQGKEALICIDQNNYKVVRIPVAPADKSVTTDSTFIHLSYTNLQGSIKQNCTGYPAWYIARITNYLKTEDRDKAIRSLLARGSDNYKQLKYEVNAAETGNKEATLTADFNLQDYAHIVGKEYYVNMNLDRMFGNQRMDDSERNVGYYYQNKSKTKEVVVLDIPEGYKVTHLPGEAHGALDGVWSYKISYKADKKKIILTKEYELQSLSLSDKEFAKNNKIIDDLNHAYKESVVLTANK